ncbi:response regulator transcription factor [Microbacterium sp. MYb62]|uniref:response regulator transcription factor n=1 Tax=Microbacterium sp. MYb62 TaxID=1848690 RepID=UPI0015E45667|nr:response regulator transcription factor [Microbacterium sp. MYb62]
MYRVAVVEDHLLQRKYATALINAQSDMAVVYDGEDLPSFMTWLDKSARFSRPRLVLLDLMVERGPNASPEDVRRLVASGMHVVLFSALASPPLARQMIQAGASGVIGKRDSETSILAALRAVLAGESWVSPELAVLIAHDPNQPRLSDQEERALVLYASGLSIDSVAASIGVKPGTAKKYLHRVREKYAAVDRPVASREELIRAAARDGYSLRHDGGTSVGTSG